MKAVPKDLIDKANATRCWTVHESDEVRRSALALARGRYQRALIEGWEAMSGSTLRGRAKQYGAHYADSAASLLRRLRAAGLGDEIRTRRGGRRVLVIYRATPPDLGVDLHAE